MHSLRSVICVCFCLVVALAEELMDSSKRDTFETGELTKRRTWKTKEDISPEYIEKLKEYYGVKDTAGEGNYDDDVYYNYDGYDPTYYQYPPPVDENFHEPSDTGDGSYLYEEPGALPVGDNFNGTNGTATAAENGTCEVCIQREERKQMRIQSIKNEILNKIGFSQNNLPNMTRHLPRPPSIRKLLEKFQMQGDSPYQPADEFFPEDEYYGQVQKAYTISQSLSPEVSEGRSGGVYFDIPESVSSRRIHNATLWVYIKRPREHANQAIEIFMYVNPTAGKMHKVLQGPKRYKKTKRHGWVEFEIGHIVRHWVRHPQTNRGIFIEALDREGQSLVASPDLIGDEHYVPTLEMSTTEHERSRRQKRSQSGVCEEEQKVARCCRYPLTVDFVEFGWDWVIAPTSYTANYCSGECRHQQLDEYPSAYIIQQVEGHGDNNPCCTPTKWFPISMLYFDHAHTVLYTNMQKMIIWQCGCA